MGRILYLFPDTNLFVQCKDLSELDWSNWQSYDEVQIVVCRPIQREIDQQKNKGNSRLAKRARATSTLFRQLITSEERSQIIPSKSVSVKLLIRQDLKPSEALDSLNYQETDDLLVGIAAEFSSRCDINSDVKILTHDTGPMASAQMVGLAFEVIPDGWLLPPEADDSGKEIRRLNEEIRKLKKSEPEFKIQFSHAVETEKLHLEVEFVNHLPLAEPQVARLLATLQSLFPKEEDFGSMTPHKSKGEGLLSFYTEEYSPPSASSITAYAEKDYPQWLETCEERLRTMHGWLDRMQLPTFYFDIANVGSRPAKDSLVILSTKANFLISPVIRATNNNQKSGRKYLPVPPDPPRGEWHNNLEYLQRGIMNSGLLGGKHPLFETPSLAEKLGRDPNKLYFKPSKPNEAVVTYSYECAQWRHRHESERLEFRLQNRIVADLASGLLQCEVHAENLAEATIVKIPMSTKLAEKDTYKIAERIVRNLKDEVEIVRLTKEIRDGC